MAAEVPTQNLRNYKLCLTLKRDLAYQILAGSKKYESRIAGSPNTKLMTLEVGDVMAFHWYTKERITVKIAGIQVFETLQEMLECVPRGELLPGAPLSLETMTEMYQKMLNFTAGCSRMIVFKLSEPEFHSDVPPKTQPKNKKRTQEESELDEINKAKRRCS